MEGGVSALIITITVIAGFWIYLIVRSLARSKVRELEIRERIALIEKGHVPPPEVNPRGFERAMERRDHGPRRDTHSSYRHRRAGTALIGVGLGLMIMIAFAGDAPQKAVGVGGFLVMIGLAFLVNGLLDQRTGPEPLQETANHGVPVVETPKID